MYKLFIHQWKEKTRSSFWQKNILINIVLSILGLYFLLNLVFISLFADKILLEVYTDYSVIEAFTKTIFYYLIFDLIARFLLQQIPIVSIQPYLTLPIKKRTLLHYPLIKSLFSFFNLLALLLFLPFFFKNIVPKESAQFSLSWLFALSSLIIANNFLNFFLKKFFSKKAFPVVLFIASVAILVYLDIAGTIAVSDYFLKAIYQITKAPYLVVVPLIMAISFYFIAYNLLKNHAYIEDGKSSASKSKERLSFLGNYGEVGQLIRVELKMILRNKRPRSLLLISGLFALYGFMFYKQENLDNHLILSLSGLLLPAMFTINYGQYLFSWESSYFDGYLTNRISSYNYIKSKHLSLSITNIIGFIIILPYALISYKIAFINASFLLYNIGISSILLLFFCTFNSSYIDLGRGQFMNYQGTGAMQFLITIPIMGIPLLIYLLFKTLDILPYYYYTIGIIGLIGMALNKYLLELIEGRLKHRKYKMAAGFRQK